jgi:hypothetical protein
MQEVRDVPGKDGIAFVEFEDEMQATVAMNGLQGFKVQQLYIKCPTSSITSSHVVSRQYISTAVSVSAEC